VTAVIRLSRAETVELADEINAAVRHRADVRVWVDPLDGAFKVKLNNGTWSPPLGTVDES
jgi:hypothetical protein